MKLNDLTNKYKDIPSVNLIHQLKTLEHESYLNYNTLHKIGMFEIDAWLYDGNDSKWDWFPLVTLYVEPDGTYDIGGLESRYDPHEPQNRTDEFLRLVSRQRSIQKQMTYIVDELNSRN